MFFSDQVGQCAWRNLLTSPDSAGLQAPRGASTWPREHRGAIGLAALLATLGIVSLASCNDSTGTDSTSPLSRGLVADAVTQQVSASAHSNSGSDTGDDSPEAGTYVPGRLLLKFRAGASKADQDRVLAHATGARVAGEIPQIGVKIVELPPNASETAQMRAFGAQAQVEFAEIDRLALPASVPNDTYYGNAWHLQKIGCPQAWETTTGSASVIIAILDTGCEATHPDLATKYVPGWNFYNNNNDSSDINGHGTAVAGAAAASSNNADSYLRSKQQ
jgi:thermitase